MEVAGKTARGVKQPVDWRGAVAATDAADEIPVLLDKDGKITGYVPEI
jgi:hypothetical protein